MNKLWYLLEFVIAVTLLPLGWLLKRFSQVDNVLIFGWYGSETVGDIAILGQLLREIQQAIPKTMVSILTFNPHITRSTLEQLRLEGTRLHSIGLSSAWQLVTSRCVIIGGGPLMESMSMPVWLMRCLLVRLSGGRVVVYGNGIGPIRSRKISLAIGWILKLSNAIILRDRSGLCFYPWLEDRANVLWSFDPAYNYIRLESSLDSFVTKPSSNTELALIIRAPGGDYIPGETSGEFLDRLAQTLNTLLAQRPEITLRGIVMHCDFPESDDHQVYRDLRNQLATPEKLTVTEGRHEVPGVIKELASSDAALCVRFHGMIFSLALDTPFLCIDYTNPMGKASFAAEVAGVTDQIIRWNQFNSAESLADDLAVLLDGDLVEHNVDYLASQPDLRIKMLRSVMRSSG